jgi:hypothetical protein
VDECKPLPASSATWASAAAAADAFVVSAAAAAAAPHRADRPAFAASAMAFVGGHGLTLVHFSARRKRFLTQRHTLVTPYYPLTPPKHPLNSPETHPLSHSKALTLS